jgi:hypothetical protein
MRSMQCNVEFGYQLSIRSRAKENHGKRWSSWPVAGPSWSKLTSSQLSGIEYASPNTSPYLWGCFIIEYVYSLTFRVLCAYTRNLDKQHTMYNTWENDGCLYASYVCKKTYGYIHTISVIWKEVTLSIEREWEVYIRGGGSERHYHAHGGSLFKERPFWRFPGNAR